jgi:hypothetical protein
MSLFDPDLDDYRDREELRREVIDERRAWRRANQCRCGGDMPGHCPGPHACPMCAPEPEEDEAEDEE